MNNQPLNPGDSIPGEYIVLLHSEFNVGTVIQSLGITPTRSWHASGNGFVATLSDEQLEQVKQDPRVRRVDPNKVVSKVPEYCDLRDRPRHPSCDIATIGTAEQIEIARAILSGSDS